ncbi:MAG: tetratricopeptide repeat protein [Acidobacteria bacterium]|nr:tetratricopeptide repeat protein [Acidobacteriota bacterium]NIM61424.1 tetratricopeptide repeat protein [Acidobacteriota bacterium]NIO58087.1 tetratricopeptide repeat protein [Acidobacteriota bacterium]NIQ29096.1 tetratricopeptide repeat protein [Acidobacteriota bacterium]NIQ83640.1 tetratricopeptide repeat protein [Acidobacteriota bacterium]
MSGWKKIAFPIIAVGGVLLLVELALVLAGVAPLAEREDPFHGFSRELRVFEPDEASGVFRTGPRAAARSFNKEEFPLEKPENAFRVFVLGGSSAFGFPWGAEQAFSSKLEHALQASWPDRDVRVVNAAGMSYGSHRLRILAHELLDYAPDLLVLYTGHNEFVERDFYDRVKAAEPLPAGLRLWLHRWRTYSALARLIAPAPAPPDEAPADAAELIGFDADRRYSSDVAAADRETVRAQFEENLRAIVAAAREAGVAVLLCTVPSNEKGWRPNQTTWPENLGFARRTNAERAIERAKEANDAGDPEAALRAVAEVEAVTVEAAGAWYEKGRALLAIGRPEEAADAFVAARDTDGQPGRAVSALNNTIRRVARDTGATLVDIEATVRTLSPDGIPGFELFEDYVHPKPGGHVLIARELWRAQTASDDEASFLAALGLPADFDYASSEAGPETTGDAESSPLLFNLAVVLENQGRYEDAIDRYRRCLELTPEYYVARANMARLLHLTGRSQEAAQEYAMVLQVRPDHLNSAIGLGDAFRGLGLLQQAEAAYRRATGIDAESPSAWNGLGSVYLMAQDYGEAERAFRRTVELDPGNLPIQANLGMAIFLQGRHDEAQSVFESSLAVRPDEPGAMGGMGALAIERGDLAAAEDWFTRVLAQDPDNPLARDGLEEVRRRNESP